MIAKYSLVLFFFTIMLIPVVAQDEGIPSVGMLTFEAKGVSTEEAQKVSNYIEAGLYKSNRFQIVTRQLVAAINAEREQQKTVLDNDIIKQGIAVGADYILKGEVTKFYKKTHQQTQKDTTAGVVIDRVLKVYTSTYVQYDVKVVDVKTGVIAATDNYRGSLNGIEHHIKNFIRLEFPYTFRILEVLKKKGSKKAKHVLVDGGFKQGLTAGVYINVFELIEENIAGQKVVREVEIGNLQVRAVDFSGNFSKCLIFKGKKEVYSRIENNAKLICKIPKSHRLFGMDIEYTY